MARKKIGKATALDEIQEGVLKSILKNVEELYRKHAPAIAKVQEDSDEKIVTVGFGVQIDCSDSAPKVKTRIRYCETTTDELIDSLEDPAQPTLFTPEETKGRGKKRASSADPVPGE